MARSRIAEAYIQMIPSFNGFGKALQQQINQETIEIGDLLSKTMALPMEEAGKKGGSRLSKGLKVGLGAAAIGVAAGTALVGGIVGKLATKAISGGLDRALNIEDAQAKLKGLGYESEQIQAISGNVLDSVRGTAFGLDDMMGTAATALAAGVQQGDDLTRYLTLVGDTATIAGAGISEIGPIFNKVQASGKAYTQELQQLEDRGLPIFTWLQEEMGVTSEEMRKMVSQGAVSSEQLLAVVEKNIGGAALASGDTFRGTVDNFNAALSRLGAGAVGGFLPIFKDIISQATPVIDALTAKLGPMAERFTEAFGPKILSAAENFFGFLLDVIDGMGSGGSGGFFGKLFGDLGPLLQLGSALSPIGILLQAIMTVGPQLGQALMPLVETIVSSLIPAIGSILSSLIPVVGAVLELWGAMGEALIPALVTLAGTLVPIITMLVDLLAPILIVLAEILGVVLPPLVMFLGKVIGVVFTGVAIVVYGLISAFVKMSNTFAKIGNFFGGSYPLMATPPPPSLPMLAKGADVAHRKGGTAVIVGEKAPETVTDYGKTNELISNANAAFNQLSSKDNSSTATSVSFTINQKEGQSAREIVDMIEEYFEMNTLKPAGFDF